MHVHEAVTSLPSSPELHEIEVTPSVSKSPELVETEIDARQPSPPVVLIAADAESAMSDEVITDVQVSGPSSPVPMNLSVHIQGKMVGFILNKLLCIKT